jgi:hypothetical protein
MSRHDDHSTRIDAPYFTTHGGASLGSACRGRDAGGIRATILSLLPVITMARRPNSAASADALSRWQVSVDETAKEPFCLALANTRNWRHGPAPLERLCGYRDLVAWIERRDLLDAAGLAALEREAAAHSRIAARELADTIALREDVFGSSMRPAGGRRRHMRWRDWLPDSTMPSRAS